MLPLKGRVGDSIQYKKTDIEKYILKSGHGLKGGIKFLGSDRVVLVRKGMLLEPETYIAVAKAAIDQQLLQQASAITTELEGDYPQLKIPVGDLTIQAAADTSGIRKEMKVWVAVEVDGQSYTSVPVTFKVKWPRSAYVLNRLVNAKSSLTEDMLTRTEVNAAGISGELVAGFDQVKGQRLRHTLEADAVLRMDDVEQRPLIVSGNEVDVMARVGGIVVQTKAVAENDGFMGQTIKARVTNTREKLLVEVIGEGRAIVSASQIHQ